MKSPLKLTGLSLSAPHLKEFYEKKPKLAWIEVNLENILGEGGKTLYYLEKIRHDYPIALHAQSLSLGSFDELNWPHLKKIKELQQRINPCLLSEHLAWTSIDGHYLHELLPLPYTEECLNHIIPRIQQVQDFLQMEILLENIPHYVHLTQSTIPEAEFLQTISKRSGCKILLDVSSIYIDSINFQKDIKKYFTTISPALVQEIHLSGFTTINIEHKEILLNSHNRHIVPAVWELFRDIIKYTGTKATIIEWEADVPSLETLYFEAYRAEQIMRETYVSKCAS